jgi:membrane protein
MTRLKNIYKIIVSAGSGFAADNCFRFSAALSFYTLFSLAPALLIAIYIAGIFASNVDFRAELTQQLTAAVGENGAQGVEELLTVLQNEGDTTLQLIFGIGVLLFSATNIFIQIQGAFNEIYKVKPAEGKGIIKEVLNRLLSLGMLACLGLVMVSSLIIDSLIVALADYLRQYFPDWAINAFTVTENLILIFIIVGVIYALFHFLPDVKINHKFKFRGALIVTLLLFVGKFGIGWYIGNSQFNELGGASSSVIILMLWVYYSSLILFFGAELILAMAKHKDISFEAGSYAKHVGN